MGCSASREGWSSRAYLPAELLEYVAAAKERLAKGEAVIPCEYSGKLHSNWTGQSRGFCSMDAMRQYHGQRIQEIRDVNGDILRHWQDLDADFTLQHCSLAGAALPPYRKLRPRISDGMAKQTATYQKALWSLPEAELKRIRTFEGLWPLATAEELKAATLQPEEATTMRLTYAAGAARLELLYAFTFGLARSMGVAPNRVQWSVKRPLRMWRKTIESFPDEFAKNDFRHCTDVYRTSITVSSLAQVEQATQTLENLGRDAYSPAAVLQQLGLGGCRAHFVVERIKNRFVNPCVGGYMDLIVNLRINGYVTELQVQLEKLAELQGDRGRAAYKWFRPFRRDPNEWSSGRADGQQGDGNGTAYCPLFGGRYKGEFENGKRHGRGTFYHANGDRYEGEFVDGKKHGVGTYFYASGDRYRGGFVEDRMDGQGTYCCANGERFEGEYVEGKRHGAGIYYYKNGTCLEGDWWRNKHVQVVSV
mmetsp:Transcript_118392/g.330223  ORF Transcript_118392/g.330223 Transcript_118392/m.330223 type:complete len:477 (+) Transcript_118392:60-1490(+)